ncbi:putative DCD domain-containing protein NRP [Helianthus annuus]|nr:putative DCD domain-containing protein NRP [Helianthus annuus]
MGKTKRIVVITTLVKVKKDGGKNSVDKRFKTLPPSESLPRDETVGGYIFVCNNDTMPENLKRGVIRTYLVMWLITCHLTWFLFMTWYFTWHLFDDMAFE